MAIADLFNWIGEAATGGVDIINALTDGLETLFVTTGEKGTSPTFFGMVVLAGVGAPLAWRFIQYLISLFKKVKPN